ncbi:uncharacterized protein LOC144448523 [Glandiceps talaboti]
MNKESDHNTTQDINHEVEDECTVDQCKTSSGDISCNSFTGTETNSKQSGVDVCENVNVCSTKLIECELGSKTQPQPEPQSNSAEQLSVISTDHDYLRTTADDLSFKLEENIKIQDPEYYAYLKFLETQNHLLREVNELYFSRLLTISTIKDDNIQMKFWTGFPNFAIFCAIFEYLESKAVNLQYWRGGKDKHTHFHKIHDSNKPGPDRKISLQDEFFIVMVRLRVGLFTRDLAKRVGVSESTISRIFVTWVNFLAVELSTICTMPSIEEANQGRCHAFDKFPDTRVVVDCTELFSETPSSLAAKRQTWSEYKHHDTFKFLVGIGPNGAVTYVSRMWGGRASDKCIVGNSNFKDYLDKGDDVMADKGFTVSAELTAIGVSLNVPAFKGSDRTQLSAREVEQSRRISEARIHIERAIGRIKAFHIFDSDMKLTMNGLAEQIFTVCAFLVNFQSPFLK